MAAINFPASPTIGQQYLATNGTLYNWDGNSWNSIPQPIDIFAEVTNSDGSGSGLDADLLDGQTGSYYQPASSALKQNTLFAGDVTGFYNSIQVLDDSHNHAFANITAKPTTVAGYGITDAVQEGDSVTLTGAVTGTATFDTNGNVSIATTHTADPEITLTGAITGTGTMTNLGSVSINTTATADPTLTLSGDVSGSATFTNLGNATLTAVVANDSHTHDGRYYTELEADTRFVNATGDTINGQLTIKHTNVQLNLMDSTYSDHYWQLDHQSGALAFRYDGNAAADFTINENGTATFAHTVTAPAFSGNASTATSAGKWTTARTLSLTGDVTGSVSIDGSSNVSINTSLTDNPTVASLTMAPSTTTNQVLFSSFVDPSGDTNWFMNQSDSSGTYLSTIQSYNHTTDKISFYKDIVTTNQIYAAYNQQVFHDSYHPTADKWTTARSLSLIGDVSGSVSWDGSANASITATVANDSHTHDGRYYTASEINTFIGRSYVSGHSALNLAVGWYTIATNAGDRASARFGIWDTNSSDHQSVTFYASHHFGTDGSNTLTVLDNSYFGGNPFRYIRIKDAGTYDGAALQIYIDDATNSVNAAILGDNFQSSGWILCDWVADATTPPNVSNYGSFAERSRIDLDEIAQGGFATTGEIYAGHDTAQHRVFHDGYHPNADKWTTARTLSLTGAVSGSVSINGSSNVSINTSLTPNATVSSLTIAPSTTTNQVSLSSFVDPSGDTNWFMNQSDSSGTYLSSIQSYNHTTDKISFYKEITTSGDIAVLNQHGLTTTGAWTSYKTAHGYIDLGPANASYAHIYTGNPAFYFNKGLYTTGTLVQNASDARLKENIVPIENPIDKIKALSGVTYNWNTLANELGGFDQEENQVGLLAQEVEAVLPEAVTNAPFDMADGESSSGEDYLTVMYEKLIPLLVEGMKEQQAQIDELKSEINALKNN